MRLFTSASVAGYVVLLAAACGSPPGSVQLPPRTPEPATSATSVVLQRSGGLKPVELTRVFATNRPPPHGYNRRDVVHVLKAASAPEIHRLPMTPRPSGSCCDHYTYTLTITWADGVGLSFRAIDGFDHAPALAKVLKLAW
ncbi:MAG: hypothetical protein ACR2KG_08990 [Nocardioidaceae bacterium]